METIIAFFIAAFMVIACLAPFVVLINNYLNKSYIEFTVRGYKRNKLVYVKKYVNEDLDISLVDEDFDKIVITKED